MSSTSCVPAGPFSPRMPRISACANAWPGSPLLIWTSKAPCTGFVPESSFITISVAVRLCGGVKGVMIQPPSVA